MRLPPFGRARNPFFLNTLLPHQIRNLLAPDASPSLRASQFLRRSPRRTAPPRFARFRHFRPCYHPFLCPPKSPFSTTVPSASKANSRSSTPPAPPSVSP